LMFITIGLFNKILNRVKNINIQIKIIMRHLCRVLAYTQML
jgi:hypothetical protein